MRSKHVHKFATWTTPPSLAMAILLPSKYAQEYSLVGTRVSLNILGLPNESVQRIPWIATPPSSALSLAVTHLPRGL